jgi:hypothetical protein
MYRLMKSEKLSLNHGVYGDMAAYRHIQVDQFQQLNLALSACEVANETAGIHHYVLNESGEEFYEGSWID